MRGNFGKFLKMGLATESAMLYIYIAGRPMSRKVGLERQFGDRPPTLPRRVTRRLRSRSRWPGPKMDMLVDTTPFKDILEEPFPERAPEGGWTTNMLILPGRRGLDGVALVNFGVAEGTTLFYSATEETIREKYAGAADVVFTWRPEPRMTDVLIFPRTDSVPEKRIAKEDGFCAVLFEETRQVFVLRRKENDRRRLEIALWNNFRGRHAMDLAVHILQVGLELAVIGKSGRLRVYQPPPGARIPRPAKREHV